MARLEFIIFLYAAVITLTPGYCETKAKDNEAKVQLPELLSDLDLASLEASEDDVEALKKVAKRLAPSGSEKNVFFGNEELLKEWLKGAGVTGQPGVDFPALTTIPATSFSCRGLKGGYYADLETNCQVFHICDNGRKISFLCPNGTIFQQSQLICDWWFKVDCSKSTELYEQSAEQLAEEERKRVEAKKMKSEFHRPIEDNVQYFENLDYNGRQNARTNPYGQSPKQNQIQDVQDTTKSTQQFNQNTVGSNVPNSNFQIGNSGLQAGVRSSQSNENFHQKPKQTQSTFSGSYQQINRQKNQLVDNQSGKFNQYNVNYDQRNANKFQGNNPNYPNTQDNYSENRNSLRNEKSNFRTPKLRTPNRDNPNNFNSPLQKVTPTYTETTTFRTTTSSPIKEFQQLAESAAFVSNRGNRFHGSNGNNHQYYHQSVNSRTADADSSRSNDRDSATLSPEEADDLQTSLKQRIGVRPYPGPTYAPIYKPRTTTPVPYETTLQYATTTDKLFYDNDYYRQDYTAETTYSTPDVVTVTPYSTNQDYQATTEYPNSPNSGESAQRNSGTSPPYWNYETTTGKNLYNDNNYSYGNKNGHNENRVTGRDTAQDTGIYSTTRSYINTESYRQNNGITNQAGTDATKQDYNENFETTTTSYFNDNYKQNKDTKNASENREDRSYSSSRITTKSPVRTSQNYRQNSIGVSTEKPSRNTLSYQQTATGKTLSPYDTSFTYKQGKVMSTLGPYIPFTKNYIYSGSTTSTTTAKPPVYTATIPTYSSTIGNYRVTAEHLLPKIRPTPGKSKATYLPESQPKFKGRNSLDSRPSTEREHALSMLHSLQGLGSDVPNLSISNKGTSGNVPTSAGPSTLHSLALYFATASDTFDSNETIDTGSEYQETKDSSLSLRNDNSTIELPTSILTQHTISSYTDLFKLNNALETNVTTEDRFDNENTSEDEDSSDDLDIQQSQGPLNGAKKTNTTKLRELAQVFTHALSAYLEDPDTFKKVLTEIRPTEPPATTSNEIPGETTTLYPTTVEEYPSVTKEKDEVLDFSDDSSGPRRRKPTTIYPTTIQPPTTTKSDYQPYYTTSSDYYTTRVQDYYTTIPPLEESTSRNTDRNGNNFAHEVNNAFGTKSTNDIRYPNGVTGPSGPSQVYDNYYPSDYSNNENRIGGFQNNTAHTFEPYGKHVKPNDATPISDNYVASSTPASYVQEYQTTAYQRNRFHVSKKPDQELTPPFYHDYGNADNEENGPGSEVSNSIVPNLRGASTTPIPRRQLEVSSTSQPFRIRYYDTTTISPQLADSSTKNRGSHVSFTNFNFNSRSTERPVTTNFPNFNYNSRSTEKPLTTNYPHFSVNSRTTERPATASFNNFDYNSRTTERSVTTNSNNFDYNSRTTERPVTPNYNNLDFSRTTERPVTTSFSNYNAINNRLVTTTILPKDLDPITTSVNDANPTPLTSNTVRDAGNQISSTTNNYSNALGDDHWTSSPTVTQLWETTVFIDPKHINHGLEESESDGTQTTVSDFSVTERTGRSTTPSSNQPGLATDVSSEVKDNQNNNRDQSTPWQWVPNNNDSPTAFTLLPTVFSNENTATPTPIYTTRSSITTTITSTVTSTSSLPQDGLVSPLSPYTIPPNSLNATENEIAKAQAMFGKLNATSSNTLMNVMKQADSNETVRQLVLLLINHCNGPTNKTTEQEKEQLLNALLKMPVNEFTSEESREIVAGINRLNLPKSRFVYTDNTKRSRSSTSSTTSTTQPPVTTFRSRKGRRFRTTTENTMSLSRRSDELETSETNNSLSAEETSVSDNRALELLRSLYTIAAKWG